MDKANRYQILEQLPTYGAMYVSVAEDDEKFYSEGFVVNFVKSDNTTWVANFKPGWTDCCFVKEYPLDNKVLVIANGMGYLMNPNSEKPEQTFGISIKKVIPFEDEYLILSNDIGIELVNSSGIIWTSPRISWDGIRNLELTGSLLTGESFDPMRDANTWINFEVNLETKEINGGSYRQHYTDHGQPIRKKPWWKIW